MDQPLHPATVHWPLALLTTAYGLDVLHALLPYLPSTLSSYLPAGVEIPRIGYYALSAGLLTSLPAVTTGVSNAISAVKTQGLYEADNKTIKPKFKVIMAHAISNDIVIAASAYMWWCKKQGTSLTYAPDTWMVALSAFLGAALLYSAHWGGMLTYNYGIGLRIGKGKGKSQ